MLVAMFIVMRQQQTYRVLFSDTHLEELGRALETARGALGDGDVTESPATFEGVAAQLERLPSHLALSLNCRRKLAPAAARFLLSFAVECAHGVQPQVALVIDRRRWALVWPSDAIDLSRAWTEPAGDALGKLRQRAADRMGQLALTEGSLVAYR